MVKSIMSDIRLECSICFILRRAKEQCSKLIVGVSTDELVRSYKQKVPVIPFEERFAIVAACRYVDEVVSQEDRDKIAAFHRIGFDVMFVGDDWKGGEISQRAWS